MTSQKATGSADRSNGHSRAREIEQLPGRLDKTNTPTARARQLVDMLVANGASFEFRPTDSVLPSYFTYSLPRGGDRWKCRGLIGEAKADPALWRAVVAEIGRRCEGAAP